MKVPIGCRMTASTAGKPWHARTLTGRCQMHAFTMKHSQGMRRPSNAARSVFKMIMTKTLAPEIPTAHSWGWLPQMGVWPMPILPQQAMPQPSATPAPREICRRFNEGRCNKQHRCKYIHTCSACSGPHPLLQCPNRPPPGRSRSPQRRGPASLPGQAANRFQ